MRAAIYLRKSTDDDKAADDKSVEQQRRATTAFIASKQWMLDDEHAYTDDGVSGGEWVKRPAFLRMMEAAKAREFDVLVMRDFNRFGRDFVRNSQFIEELVECGIGIWLADTGEQVKFETPTDKMMVGMKAGFGESHRYESSRQGHMRAKDMWNQKRVIGGRVYGYDNVWVHSDGTRELAPVGRNKPYKDVKTVWQINDAEAAIVRSLFQLYADGYGLVAIAKTLNGDPKYKHLSLKHFNGKRPPSPTRKIGSWAPSGIREMLRNPRYIGRIPFGAHKWVYVKGTKKRKLTGTVDYTDAPELRIVDDSLWQAVQARISAWSARYVREDGGHWWGAPGRESKYLLSGLLKCGVCGRAMVAGQFMSGSPGKRQKVYIYECGNYSKRGPTVCQNNRRVRVEKVEERVIAALEGQLRPDLVAAAVNRAAQLIAEQRRRNPERPAQIEAEIKKLHKQMGNLINLAAEGDAPKAVAAEIRSREARVTELGAELARLVVPERVAQFEPRRLERDLTARVAKFRELLRSNVPQARQALRKLLAGPIQFEPLTGKDFNLRGNSQLDALMETSARVALPRGFEPLLPA